MGEFGSFQFFRRMYSAVFYLFVLFMKVCTTVGSVRSRQLTCSPVHLALLSLLGKSCSRFG